MDPQLLNAGHNNCLLHLFIITYMSSYTSNSSTPSLVKVSYCMILDHPVLSNTEPVSFPLCLMPLNIYFTVEIRSFTNCCVLHVSRTYHRGLWLLLSHRSTLKASLPDLYSNPQTRRCQCDCNKSARQCEEIKYCCQGK